MIDERISSLGNSDMKEGEVSSSDTSLPPVQRDIISGSNEQVSTSVFSLIAFFKLQLLEQELSSQEVLDCLDIYESFDELIFRFCSLQVDYNKEEVIAAYSKLLNAIDLVVGKISEQDNQLTSNIISFKEDVESRLGGVISKLKEAQTPEQVRSAISALLIDSVAGEAEFDQVQAMPASSSTFSTLGDQVELTDDDGKDFIYKSAQSHHSTLGKFSSRGSVEKYASVMSENLYSSGYKLNPSSTSSNCRAKLSSITLALILSGFTAMLAYGLINTALQQDITSISQVTLNQWELVVVTVIFLYLSGVATKHAYDCCSTPSTSQPSLA